MGEPANLKEGNKKALTLYVSSHGVLLAWAILGLPSSLISLKSIAESQWMKAGGIVLLTILVTMLNRYGKDRIKGVLVFWRIKNILPGCRAFTELAGSDPRIDLKRVRQAVGSDLPTDPSEQNKAWYRLYQQVRDSASIQDAHKDYLLFRDITWLTLPIAIVCQLFLMSFGNFKMAAIHFGVCVIIYLLSRLAARMAAESLVRTVLACAGEPQELAQSKIVQA